MITYSLPDIHATPELLQEVHLPYAGLHAWPEELRACTRLKVLNLTGNHLTELPSWLNDLPSLEKLILSHNQLTQLDLSRLRLPVLSELMLSGNAITVLRGSWQGLPRLHKLQLAQNRLRTLPTELAQARSLQYLDVSQNPLSSCPEVVFQLGQLRQLFLEQTRLKDIPDQWGALSRLETLWLSRNKLTALPPSLTTLATLQDINLERNRLTSFPPVLLEVRFLRKLNLAYNNLTTLPGDWSQLSWLAYLDLQHNALTALPPGFGKYTRVEHLNLNGNRLTALPDLSHLFCLRKLTADGNQLREIGPMPEQLTQLHLRRNPDLVLEHLVGAPHLQRLDIGYTAFRGPTPHWTTGQQLVSIKVDRTPFANTTTLPTSALQWRNLRQMPGFGTPAIRSLLLRINACGRERLDNHFVPLPSFSDRQVLWNLLWPSSPDFTGVEPAWCLRCLQWPFPELWPGCREKVWNEWGIPPEQKLLQENGVQWLGEPAIGRRDLKTLLAEHAIPLREDGIPVLGKPPYREVPDPKAIRGVLDAAALLRWLQQRPESNPVPPEQRRSIRRLLFHADPVNQRLALQMIQSKGIPRSVLPELVVQWKRTHDPAIRRTIRQLLEQYLPPGDRIILQKRLAFPPDLSPEAFRQKMLELVAGSQLEVTEILEEGI